MWRCGRVEETGCSLPFELSDLQEHRGPTRRAASTTSTARRPWGARACSSRLAARRRHACATHQAADVVYVYVYIYISFLTRASVRPFAPQSKFTSPLGASHGPRHRRPTTTILATVPRPSPPSHGPYAKPSRTAQPTHARLCPEQACTRVGSRCLRTYRSCQGAPILP